MLNKFKLPDTTSYTAEVYAITETSDSLYIGGRFDFLTDKTKLSSYGVVLTPSTAVLRANLDFNGAVTCSVEKGDYIYFGGSFTIVNNYERKGVVKISKTTGAVDETFDTATGFDGKVSTIAVDSSGNIFVGGDFLNYKGASRPYLAKLNGSTAARDTNFGGSVNGSVHAIAVDSSNNIFIGGSFTTCQATTRQRIAKLDNTGSLVAAFNAATGFDSEVHALALDGSNVYAGGYFTAYKSTSRLYIAKLNGSTAALDTAFNTATGGANTGGFNSSVHALALDGSGNVYVGGYFTAYKGTSRLYIAKLNGSTAALDADFNTATGGVNTGGFSMTSSSVSVFALALDGLGNIYVGGQFDAYKNTTRQYIAKLNASTAALDTDFNTASGFNNIVRTIAVDSSGNIFVGGDFNVYKNSTENAKIMCQNIAKILKSTESIDTAFNTASGFNNIVRTIAVDSSGNVFVGGDFTTYKGTSRQYIAKLNGSTAALDADFNTATGGVNPGGFGAAVQTLVVDSSGNVYAGGFFTTYRGISRLRIAKLNGSNAALDTDFNTATAGGGNPGGFDNNGVLSLALDGLGNIYVGGTFTTYRSTTRQRIAKLNGSTAALDTNFNTATGMGGAGFAPVSAIVLDGSGNVYAGGDFTTYKGSTRGRLVKLSASNAAIDTTFNTHTGFSSRVKTLALDGSGNIYVGGNFASYTDSSGMVTNAQRVAKLNASSAAIDTDFNTTTGFTGEVYALCLDSNANLNIGGYLSAYKVFSPIGLMALNKTTAKPANYLAIAANTAPAEITLSSSSIAENTQGTRFIGNFSSTDVENNVTSYALVAGSGDTHNSLFQIIDDSGTWKLRTSAVFDYENMPAGAIGKTLSIRVQATDAGGLSYSKALTINITNVNEQPSGITLSGAVSNAVSIAEGNAVGAIIGTLSAIDPDTGDVPTLSLENELDRFEVVNNQLKAKISFDYEDAASYSITIRATDAGGLSRTETFTINIINDTADDPVNAAAAVSGTGNKVYMRSAKNPKAVPHRFNNQPIVEGSVVVYPNNSQQKYYKLAGGALELYQIPITAPAEWGWDEASVAAWAVLQSFN